MVELEIIIASATMIYIVKTFFYELHPMNKCVFNDSINDK